MSHEPRPSRASLLGCEIDRLDMAQTLALCESFIESRGFAQHMAINAAKVVALQGDEHLREIVNACQLVSADGQSIVWALRLLGDPIPGRVAGIDLMMELLALAEARGYRVYILGASQEVLERGVERIRLRHPGLTLAGYRNGYFPESDDAAVAEEVRAARPDILFVAISSPRKEYWLGRHGREVGAPFVMGVGGSVDVIAGLTRRAPVIMQRLGLEWLFRLAQEPRRLLRRYLVTNWRFTILVAKEALRRRR